MRRAILALAPVVIVALAILGVFSAAPTHTKAQLTMTGVGCAVTCAAPGYLLDGLSNVVVAYSSRRLATAYAGNALQVIRSSDSTTSNIGFSGADLNNSAMASFVGANTGRLNLWYDQSGNTTNAAPGNTNGPVLINTGTANTINGQACAVYFNGAIPGDDYLQFTASNAQPTAYAIVFKITTQVLNAVLTDGVGATRQLMGPIQSASQYAMYAGGTGQNAGTIDLNLHTIIGIFDGASTDLFVDGTQLITNTSVGTAAMVQQLIGAGNGGGTIDGYICEYIAFSSHINSTVQTKIGNSETAYWGTPTW